LLLNALERSLEPREHLIQVDHDFSPCDPPPNPVPDDTVLSLTGADFYRPVTPVEEPHLLEAEREVRVALELATTWCTAAAGGVTSNTPSSSS
jgi:hypothetical protein